MHLGIGDRRVAKHRPKKPGRPKKPEDQTLEYSFTIRSRKPWREWLQSAANALDCEMVEVVDEGLVLLAEAKGLPKPPKR
jgi:hypothetical protein